MQHFTGSREHNIQFRELAVRKNLRVSENGIVDLSDGRTITCRTEAEVYAAVGLAYVPPELRLGIGEIEAARDGTLPQVVELADLKGDFHMHCTWSDGRDTLEAMIAACAARGYAYHAITDHSWGRGGMGLDPADLRAQRARVRELGERHGIRTLCAAEVDIRADGTLDYDDAILAELDFVVASVHSALQPVARGDDGAPAARDREPVRERDRPPDRPQRRDLRRLRLRPRRGLRGGGADRHGARDRRPAQPARPAQLARAAGQGFGCTFSCDSDAHRVADLGNVAYAVGQARRAWLGADDSSQCPAVGGSARLRRARNVPSPPMKAAPQPPDEDRRLAALYEYELLDTPAEELFDTFTALAAQLCGTPIALISLIDAERQWFKSAVGLEGTQVARDVSLCATRSSRTASSRCPTRAADPRFAHAPAVVGRAARSASTPASRCARTTATRSARCA